MALPTVPQLPNIEAECRKNPKPPFRWHYKSCCPTFTSGPMIDRLPEFDIVDSNDDTGRRVLVMIL